MSERIATLAAALAGRRPGWSLERAFYADPEVFAHDLAVVFERHWQFVGHVAQLAGAGDWFTVVVAGESLIIARAADGAVHALFNVCRHRGSRICLAETGHAKRLVCPYHQWSFAHDGALVAARGMPEGFDKAAFGLHRARTRVCEGLIFVCLRDDAPDFAPIAADLSRFLAPHRLGEAGIAHTADYVVQGNWKLILENFRECYHCPGTHPEYCSTVFGTIAPRPPEGQRRRTAQFDAAQARWRAQGLAVDNVPFRPDAWHHVGRGLMAEGWQSWTVDGRPCAPLMGDLPDRDTGLVSSVMYPSFWLEGGCDYLTTTRVLPVSATSSSLRITWYVAPGATAGVDLDVARMRAVWQATAEQDMKLVEDNQAGVNSSRYQPGPYAVEEAPDIEHFHAWYQRQWSDAAAESPRRTACRA